MILIAMVFLLLGVTRGKIYDRCELARELKFVQNAPDHQLATWVCIAEHESQYNTSIVGHKNEDGSGDHGIFQISDKFWCSPPGKGFACGVTCAELEDDNISDDFICAQRIYKEHKQLSGDGFNAWAVYKPHCKGPKADRYIKDCFDSESPKSISAPGFAHGFFDTAAGRGGLLTPEQPAFEPILNLGAPAFIQSTENPDSFLTSKSTFVGNNRLFTSTLDPNGDLFFTPPSSTFRPIISRTSTYTPPATRNLASFNPIIRTSTTVAPTLSSRSSIFQFGNTLRTSTAAPPTIGRGSNFQFGNTATSVPQTLGSRSSAFQFGNTLRTTPSPQTIGRGSNFQFGNTVRTTSVPQTLPSRSSIFQFGNTARTTSVPQTVPSRSSAFQFGNTLRTTTTAPSVNSRASNFQFGNTARTTSVPQTLGSRSSAFQFGNTFSSRSDTLFPSSTPNYQSSTVNNPAPVFIINGEKWY